MKLGTLDADGASNRTCGEERRRIRAIRRGFDIWVLMRMPYNVDIVNVTPIEVVFT
jgi:hypothetical protein